MYGDIPDAEIVQCLAVSDNYTDKVLAKGSFRPPGLPQAKYDVWFRCNAMSFAVVTQIGEETVRITENL